MWNAKIVLFSGIYKSFYGFLSNYFRKISRRVKIKKKGARISRLLHFTSRRKLKEEIMKKNNMMKSAMLMMLAAMAINSCSTSKNGNKEIKDENQVARPDNDMDMDEEYLTLSDAQLDILQKNNKFAFNFFQKVSGMDSKVVSPMSVSYLMGMLANGADGETQQEIMKAIGCDGVSVKELNELYKLLIMSAGKLDSRPLLISPTTWLSTRNIN